MKTQNANNQNKINGIYFTLHLDGHGVVQTDQNRNEGAGKGNCSVPKTNYYKDSDGSSRRVVKISGDCIRHAIHKNAHFRHVQNVNTDESRMDYISNIDTLIRGFLIPNRGQKTSAYTIGFAEANQDVQIRTEIFTNATARVNEDGASTSTGMFFRETIGKAHYVGFGAINFDSLRFISLCDVYGRRAVADDDAVEFIAAVEKQIGMSIGDVGFYNRVGSAYNVPERGILLSDEVCSYLLKHLFRNMSQIFISKSQQGMARATKIEVELIYDNGERATHEIFGDRGLDLSVFDSVLYLNQYESTTKEKYDSTRSAIDNLVNEKAENKKKEKEEKKREKEEKIQKRLKAE